MLVQEWLRLKAVVNIQRSLKLNLKQYQYLWSFGPSASAGNQILMIIGFKAEMKVLPRKSLNNAVLLESLGVSALVLECIPSDLAKTVSEKLTIPTIGIGAGVIVMAGPSQL